MGQNPGPTWPKMGQKTASDGGLRAVWGLLELHFGPFLRAPGRAQMEPETAPKTGAEFKQFWGLPWDPQAVRSHPLGMLTGWFLRPGGTPCALSPVGGACSGALDLL